MPNKLNSEERILEILRQLKLQYLLGPGVYAYEAKWSGSKICGIREIKLPYPSVSCEACGVVNFEFCENGMTGKKKDDSFYWDNPEYKRIKEMGSDYQDALVKHLEDRLKTLTRRRNLVEDYRTILKPGIYFFKAVSTADNDIKIKESFEPHNRIEDDREFGVTFGYLTRGEYKQHDEEGAVAENRENFKTSWTKASEFYQKALEAYLEEKLSRKNQPNAELPRENIVLPREVLKEILADCVPHRESRANRFWELLKGLALIATILAPIITILIFVFEKIS